MPGFISLSRDIERHWIWLDAHRLKWWIKLLFMASYEPRLVSFRNYTVELERGQIATTIRLLANSLCTTVNSLYSFLKVLEADNMIVRKPVAKLTIITIVNYDKYQCPAPNQAVSERKVERELQRNNNKEQENNNIHFTSREGEQKFFEELRQSQIFWEETAMSLSCDIGLARKLGEKFFVEVLAKESYHGSLQELKQHLVNWLRIALRKDVAPNNQKTTNYKSSKNEDERYAVRRGTGVAAHSADDYRKPF